MKEKGYLIYEKKRDNLSIIPSSGERGIRTPGPVTVNGFQDRRFKPLSHLSGAKIHFELYPQKKLLLFTIILLFILLKVFPALPFINLIIFFVMLS